MIKSESVYQHGVQNFIESLLNNMRITGNNFNGLLPFFVKELDRTRILQL
jgi:hypothetical protein